MDTQHGNDFEAKGPPRSVADWGKNVNSPPMVTSVSHLSSGAFYWFLFNHAGSQVSAGSIFDSYNDWILGDVKNLERVDFVITCYPRKVKAAMLGVGNYMKGNRFTPPKPGITAALFTKLAGRVVGLDYYGTTSIGHSDGFAPNRFWIEFTDDDAVY